ncbi:MAG: CBS domain-containing protein [Nitrospinales bacterium]
MIVNAKDIMTTKFISVKKDMLIEDLSKHFIEHRVNGFPVVDENDELIGVVTEKDLIEQNKNLHMPTVIALFDAVIYLESGKNFKDEVNKFTGTRVSDILTSNPTTVSPETPIVEVASIMANKDIHTLPVVNKNTIVGVIGKIDLIKGLAKK